VLADHRIYSAADIDRETVMNIKGFGESLTKNLLDWKAGVLRTFQFDPAKDVLPGEQRSLTMKYRTRQQQLFAEADKELSKLEPIRTGCSVALQALIPDLQVAVAALDQAEGDLSLLLQQ
jgi:DNA-binding helix-hairpin-helix protein with protein kinase domain